MHEVSVKTKTAFAEDGTAYTYLYSILVDYFELECCSCESYGVIITNQDKNETVSVPHVTMSSARIQTLVERLAKNTASPCNLLNIIEDWL